MTAEADVRAPTDLADVRAAARRSRWGRRALWLLPVVVLGAAVVWVVWFSSLLGVTSIEVRGSTTLTAASVRQAAGVAIGTPLARVDDAAVASRLRALPRVGAVEVRRGFPHDLVLVVDERIAVAVISTGEGWRSIDSSGDVVSAVRGPGALPVVRASGAGKDSALKVLLTLPPAVARQTRTIVASTSDDVVLTLASGDTVRWGNAGRAADKAAVLVVLQKQPGRVYDVSAPDFPSIRS